MDKKKCRALTILVARDSSFVETIAWGSIHAKCFYLASSSSLIGSTSTLRALSVYGTRFSFAPDRIFLDVLQTYWLFFVYSVKICHTANSPAVKPYAGKNVFAFIFWTVRRM